MPYIDRDELRKWIEGEIKSPSCPIGERPFGKRILMKIATTPTVEVTERKRGKWLINKGLYECSSCHQLWTEWWAISKPIERMKKECPYCPMCGSYNGEETDDGGKSEE